MAVQYSNLLSMQGCLHWPLVATVIISTDDSCCAIHCVKQAMHTCGAITLVLQSYVHNYAYVHACASIGHNVCMYYHPYMKFHGCCVIIIHNYNSASIYVCKSVLASYVAENNVHS